MASNIVYVTKWGLFAVHPLLLYYVDFNYLYTAIQREHYLISSWLFKNLPKIFKREYVTYGGGKTELNVKNYVMYFEDNNGDIRPIQNANDVKRLIKKLESVEGMELSEDKKDEIANKAKEALEGKEDIRHVEMIDEYFNAPFGEQKVIRRKNHIRRNAKQKKVLRTG